MSPTPQEQATIAALAASEKLGQDISVFDVSQQLPFADYFVIVSADNERQISSIVDEVEDKMREAGVKPVNREGVRDTRWALVDFGDIIVHIMRESEREFYNLDGLWGDCPRLEVEGIESTVRPEDAVNIRTVSSIDQIPLATPSPDEDEL
ncbi:MAG: ribosome silencing factor [Corynebacterium sp.]|nr:ribosome silencing factor [Corynebacterium sp.]